MQLLRLCDIKKTYPVRRNGHKYNLAAVNGVNLQIDRGTCVGLVGESGCGKSTLGRVITGLEPPTEGTVALEGKLLGGERKLLYRKIQMVFQDSIDAVNGRYAAEKIIGEPLRNYFKITGSKLREEVDRLLMQVGLSPEDRGKYPHQFSGGQLQRVCIARALAVKPELIVLDEPLSSLDVSVQAQILNLLQDLKEAYGLSYILISHDLEAVYYLADSIAVMYGGKIMEQISSMSKFNSMLHPYTMKLLSSTPAFRSRQAEGEKGTGTELDSLSTDVIFQDEGFHGCPYSGRCHRAEDVCSRECPELKPIGPGHMAACYFI